MSYRMCLSYIIIVPFLTVLWIYLIFVVKNSLVTNTSIEVNIIDHNKNVVDAGNIEKNSSRKNNEVKAVLKKVKYHVPKFMLELYEKNKCVRKQDAKADLVRSLIPTKTEKLLENDVLEELSENHLLVFDIPTAGRDENFIAAELKILTQIEIRSKQEIGVTKRVKISIYSDLNKTYLNLQQLQIHHLNDTWLSFDLTKEVKKILETQSEKKFLKVIVTVSAVYLQSQNKLKLSILPASENVNHDHDYPILLLSYSIDDEYHTNQQKNVAKTGNNLKRKRRNIEEDYEEETNIIWNGDIPKKNLKKYKRNNCKRKPLYVDFSEIRYDLWIVQPPGYDAYQCQGRCFYPVAEHLSPTKHAIMQALVHSVNPLKASRLCCVPTLLDSISILYVDDKGVLTYRYAYKDMVVLECGCR